MTSLIRHWRRFRWPPLLVDTILASACFLTITTYAAIAGILAWWLVALAAANALPLLWRRRYPLLVAAAVGVSTIWLSLLEAIGQFPAAQLVATYTLAALSSPARRLIGVVATVVGIAVSLLVPKEPVLVFGPITFSFVVAYTLGTGHRARRHRIAMLEERARRHAEEQAAAATRERERIAREMHDILAHSMSLVIVQAEAGPVAVRSDPDKAEQVFDTISATAREALAQLRRALGVLRADQPDQPYQPGSQQGRQPQPDLAALPALLDRVRQTGLAVTLEERGHPQPVPADLAVTAYRIVQESLTNTIRHAQATSARVRLTWRTGLLTLEVRDDGRGPDGNGATGGYGLVGMRERVATAGGELATGAGTGGTGFQVAATLPIPAGPALQ